jgi:hypothetical protein
MRQTELSSFEGAFCEGIFAKRPFQTRRPYAGWSASDPSCSPALLATSVYSRVACWGGAPQLLLSGLCNNCLIYVDGVGDVNTKDGEIATNGSAWS